ncbi:hypothetical protein TNCV_3370351 [Trichonephila clavipes]|nr:hypothetical protein TNCV_3370351 [Trichonephila clavipes]
MKQGVSDVGPDKVIHGLPQQKMTDISCKQLVETEQTMRRRFRNSFFRQRDEGSQAKQSEIACMWVDCMHPAGWRTWFVADFLNLRLRVRPRPKSWDLPDAENRQRPYHVIIRSVLTHTVIDYILLTPQFQFTMVRNGHGSGVIVIPNTGWYFLCRVVGSRPAAFFFYSSCRGTDARQTCRVSKFSSWYGGKYGEGWEALVMSSSIGVGSNLRGMTQIAFVLFRSVTSISNPSIKYKDLGVTLTYTKLNTFWFEPLTMPHRTPGFQGTQFGNHCSRSSKSDLKNSDLELKKQNISDPFQIITTLKSLLYIFPSINMAAEFIPAWDLILD